MQRYPFAFAPLIVCFAKTLIRRWNAPAVTMLRRAAKLLIHCGIYFWRSTPFTIDATPVEADVRSDFASYSTMVQPGKDYSTQKELIIIPGSKAELNSDGEPGRDTLTLVVYARSANR